MEKGFNYHFRELESKGELKQHPFTELIEDVTDKRNKNIRVY